MSVPDVKVRQAFLKKAKKVRVGIVGDSMLDIFSYGTSERMSPEAPVPVIDLQEREFIPGGAANVARNVTSLGAQAVLFSVIGKDKEGALLEKMLKKEKVTSSFVNSLERPTTVKERILEDGKHFVRIDRESKKSIVTSLEDKLIARFKKEAKKLDVLVFSDYAKGVITKRIVNEFCTIAHIYNLPILVDTKPKNAALFRKQSISLFTPNAKEALEISKTTSFTDAALHLQKYFASPILITKGHEGMTLYHGKDQVHLDAHSSLVVDVSGCGDTVIGTLAIALGAEMHHADAISFANHAAGIVVQKKGTATVTQREFVRTQK